MHEIFKYEQTGLDEHRVAKGYFKATGVRPHCLERLGSAGYELPAEMFEQRILSEKH